MLDWPDLNYQRWRDTGDTLQLWLQIVGKVRMRLTPWRNHSWSVPFYLSARGLTTGLIPHPGGESLECEFDLIDHRLTLRTTAGESWTIDLRPGPVSQFYAQVMAALDALAMPVRIVAIPSEIADPVPFAADHTPRRYDPAAAHQWWRAMLLANRALATFRTGFLGKTSPVHLFWGAMDLAETRFSGRRAPPHPGGMPGLPDRVVREAYSHEVSSAGFWGGDPRCPEAAFYAYAYPEPAGFSTAPVPAGARYDAGMGEFILPYAAVRTAADPEALVAAFLAATYDAAADNADWDRAALECAIGLPGVVREV